MIKIIFWGATLFFSKSAASQIQGDVVDSNDKVVPNALIIATNSVSNKADTVKTDSRGFFSFSGLKPGKYKIEAKCTDFLPALFKEIMVNEGDTGSVEGEEDFYKGTRLDITLTSTKVPK